MIPNYKVCAEHSKIPVETEEDNMNVQEMGDPEQMVFDAASGDFN